MKLKLLKQIIQKSKTGYSSCADILGISVPSFQRKINGTQPMYLEEIEKLGNFLNLDGKQKTEIAFGKEN